MKWPGTIHWDVQQLARDVCADASGRTLVQVHPHSSIGHVVAVTGGIDGFIEIGCNVNSRFPFTNTVLNL